MAIAASRTTPFGRVVHRASRVAIFGTGSSLAGFDCEMPDDVTVIAVNGAIEFLPRAEFWFTLDPSAANLARMQRRRPGTTYYAALRADWERKFIPGVHYLIRKPGAGHGRYRTLGGLSDDGGVIHNGNSAWGALQLAVLMGAERIGLFGVDGAGEYFGGGTPRNLTMIPALFASAVGDLARRNVAVMNGSPRSEVTCFPRMTPRAARGWLEMA